MKRRERGEEKERDRDSDREVTVRETKRCCVNVQACTRTSEFLETTFLTTAGKRSEQSLPLATICTHAYMYIVCSEYITFFMDTHTHTLTHTNYKIYMYNVHDIHVLSMVHVHLHVLVLHASIG